VNGVSIFSSVLYYYNVLHSLPGEISPAEKKKQRKVFFFFCELWSVEGENMAGEKKTKKKILFLFFYYFFLAGKSIHILWNFCLAFPVRRVWVSPIYVRVVRGKSYIETFSFLYEFCVGLSEHHVLTGKGGTLGSSGYYVLVFRCGFCPIRKNKNSIIQYMQSFYELLYGKFLCYRTFMLLYKFQVAWNRIWIALVDMGRLFCKRHVCESNNSLRSCIVNSLKLIYLH
jgi:hypothetical protein